MIQRHETLGTHVQAGQRLGRTGKLVILVVLADESLHHPDGPHVLLDAAVQVVIAREHLLEEASHSRDDTPQGGAQEHHRHHKDQREARIDDHTHHHGEHQPQRCSHGDAHNLLEGLLEALHVGGHSGDEARGGEAVDIGKGELLDTTVHGAAQVGGKARRGIGRRPPGSHAEHQGEQSQQEHPGTVAPDSLQVAAREAAVDELSRHVRNKHVHHHLGRREQRRSQGSSPITAYLIVQRAQHLSFYFTCSVTWVCGCKYS